MPIISPTAALLLLLKENKEDRGKYKELSKMLFVGRTLSNYQEFDRLMMQVVQKYDFEISRDPNFIHADPLRRYFETHVAYSFLKRKLPTMNLSLFESIFQNIDRSRVVSISQKAQSMTDGYEATLEGSVEEAGGNKQYAHGVYSTKIGAGFLYREFAAEERVKLKNILKSAYAAVAVVAAADISYHEKLIANSFPLNIYGLGIYAPHNRGLVSKDGKENVISSHYGIMRAYDPLPISDLVFREVPTSFPRAPESSNFNSEAYWPKISFGTLVDPFVNSISGTILCQLRILKSFYDDNRMSGIVASEFLDYLMVFASTLLLELGGHSYNEFMFAFQLPEVQKEFASIVDFSHFNYVDQLLDSSGLDAQLLQTCLDYFSILNDRKNMQEELLDQAALKFAIQENNEAEIRILLNRGTKIYANEAGKLITIPLNGIKLTSSNMKTLFLAGRRDFSGVDLSHIDLSEVNLAGVNLTGANFSGANLTRTNFSGANFSGVNLASANLTEAIVYDVIFDKNTYFSPMTHLMNTKFIRTGDRFSAYLAIEVINSLLITNISLRNPENQISFVSHQVMLEFIQKYKEDRSGIFSAFRSAFDEKLQKLSEPKQSLVLMQHFLEKEHTRTRKVLGAMMHPKAI